jgi:hypothetical protein
MNEAGPKTTWHNVAERENVLDQWLDESNSKSKPDTVSSAAYRRLHIEKHRAWFALTSAGVTLLLMLPGASRFLSSCSGILSTWLGW